MNQQSIPNKILSSPVQFGDLKLKNRFIQAPLTRLRSDLDTGLANNLMNIYYSQRASFGLQITETVMTHQMKGYFPYLINEQQSLQWRKIVDSVHQQGGLICLQISHGGRTNISSMGSPPVAPSPIKINGKNKFANNEIYEAPEELTIQEIKQIVKDFQQSAVLAKQSGFDAIQLHAANGFLVDQFLRESSNLRTDEYGGSIPNRCKFCLEIIDELISVFGNGRVSIRFSPVGRYNQMYDSNPLDLMKHLFIELEKRNLSFVELRRFGKFDLSAPVEEAYIHPELQIPNFFKTLRQYYSGNIVANDGINIKEAEILINDKIADAISFGKLSISNPDLPIRYDNDYEINNITDHNTFYSQGPQGYIDYPQYNKL
ncbi:FAD/FMN-binding family oxidoreductase (macronuclear) [Tetrahymena thermophila SB210]|uniref:FAD/FMN-binding family oxidoreductase n=1 Tax=Tetrahymena thermophila (strain SB210) TaxID=312017 RepID=I7LU62_TETTS|nr:FAD/FMN-binding family oxidoreductase [Tetrahymena thermophila SB210]EAR89966.1 FAD/FMN-binding family oxidoreductase [Tetrahymena thermophila SB210]|eukprot:XP_001010211.1 FAD/FMN-binding family oxidoreductase [Tetrahymena thermophila SB210]